FLIDISHFLDSVYYLSGNMDSAYHYASLNHQFIQRQNRENDQEKLLKLEISNEVKKHELFVQQRQSEIQRKHNIQYQGMVLAIIICFVILCMLSSFKINKWFLKAMGFFSFIFLFEFI